MTNAFPQYPKRDFSPYAIDGCDLRIDSPRVSSRSKSSLLISPPSESYDLKLDEKSHQYEDPSNLCDQVRALQGGDRRPRKRYNEMYEPHIPLKNLAGLRSSAESVSSDGYTRESCLNRFLLLFVLFTSLAALILVVLMMLGKVGPSQCSCNTEQRAHGGKRHKFISEFRYENLWPTVFFDSRSLFFFLTKLSLATMSDHSDLR